MPTVFLTGGTGYIGSHTCVELIEAGYQTVLLDNLCNSSRVVVDRIEKITGTRPAFFEGDVRDRPLLDRVVDAHAVDAVIHFAGLKAVGESVAHPLDYYANNVCGAATLLQAMEARGVRRIVFSSSATVYGMATRMPLTESSPTGPVNPYGHSKLMVEQVLHDLARSDPRWRVLCLRYFNPVGAHESGTMGEDPRDTPNNLMPYIAQVAVGRLPRLRIFGSDYPTPDGTGVRDYIHVMDLAAGHVAALGRLLGDAPVEHPAVNLGTGRGHSVLEVVRAFEAASGRPVPYDVVERRDGDVAVSYADVGFALRYLGWKAERGIDAMCADAWQWQAANPNGYGNG
ncbi:MAG: UDP-glucose 4-epimerase GalE [Betaproteobacteria bacterium]|nr:UDP-glucose 4-epimerase GalE [Betaproteobacteria bacterium]